MTKQQRKALAAIGRQGGQAHVPKGFAMQTEEKRKAIAKVAAAKRWKKAD